MNNTFQLNLDLNQLRVIDAALLEMPYKIAAPVIKDINEQLAKQRTEPKES